ncbi:MAG: F0F1 ATP synthase subunit epsilon [Dehalococcoidales bacterium]|jgi:F-type H+-transporting ATPase subunit epsilon|nr:F0F1 ATP synthase subunit epsilon [Dehalococcoidales bacterium]
MSPVRLEIVTAEKMVFSEEIDALVAPGVEGALGILPNHVPLMTLLDAGEMKIRKGHEEFYIAVSGGFLEVRPDKIIVLADSAERDDEIDLSRAEEARRRAVERIGSHATNVDIRRAEAALHRSMARIKVARRTRRGGETQL